eukprot:tig00021314_g20121.t1
MAGAARQLPKITLFTSKTCSLCDAVKFVIGKTRQRVPFAYEEVYIDKPENARFFNEYRYDIPVIHLDGSEIARHRLDEAKLLSALEKRGATPDPPGPTPPPPPP